MQLCVRYTLAIADGLRSLAENYDYCFEGVSSEVVNTGAHEPVTAFPTRIQTISGLKQVLVAFGNS
jgi:hypothetical protein